MRKSLFLFTIFFGLTSFLVLFPQAVFAVLTMESVQSYQSNELNDSNESNESNEINEINKISKPRVTKNYLDPAILQNYIDRMEKLKKSDKSFYHDQETQSEEVLVSDWERISIPDAYCGDGLPYSVFVRRGSTEKLSIGFMGGGACWSAATCWGPNLRTWIHPIPFMIPFGGIFSKNKTVSHVAEDTQIFLPYCTGDVFLGRHQARYFLGLKVNHYGYDNMLKTFAYLDSKEEINFKTFQRVLVHGSSAGALGALVHFNHISPYLNKEAHKELILDSPGLHFGDTFWDKFTPKLRADFREGINKMGMVFNDRSGLLASQLSKLCELYPDWSMTFLQASRDIIMSALFGEVSPSKHHQLVFSSQGIDRATASTDDRCVSWIPDSYYHTFLLQNLTMASRLGEESLKEFLEDAARNPHQDNKRGRWGRPKGL